MSSEEPRDFESTNKLWARRLKLVNEISKWVADNLKKKQRRHDRNLQKGQQYVYQNIIIGKMLFPDNGGDELFTFEDFDDESMRTEIYEEKYTEFKRGMNKVQSRLCDTTWLPNITWDKASSQLEQKLETQSIDVLQTLQDQLCETRTIEKGPVGQHTNKIIEQTMIELVLRYKCVGGFDNNLHCSVSETWSETLKDFTECFASPLNHKFPSYFSMFDHDKAFGSKGNFFNYVNEQSGKLPSGSYQINPPWINVVFERIADILHASMGNDIIAVIVAPNWGDAKFVEQFDALLEIPKYKTHSKSGINTMDYQQDALDKKLEIKSRYWFLSFKEIPHDTLSSLQLT